MQSVIRDDCQEVGFLIYKKMSKKFEKHKRVYFG